MLGSGYSICRRQLNFRAGHVLYRDGNSTFTTIKRECQKSLGNPLCRQCYIGDRHDILRLRRVCCPAVAPTIKNMVFPDKTALRWERNYFTLKFRNLRRNRTASSCNIERQICQRRKRDLIQPCAVFSYVTLVNLVLCICPPNHMTAFASDINDFMPPTRLAANGDTIESVALLVECSLWQTIYRKICIVKDVIAVRFARCLPPE